MVNKKYRHVLNLVIGVCVVCMVMIEGSIQGSVERVSAAPAPFMYRPFYGDATVSQRTVSFLDHDKPWYDFNNVFVRYDGTKSNAGGMGVCSGGVNCYDGHNGYDLNMAFEPVLSAAAGKVIRAGWYNPVNHNDSFGLWVAVDHKNGYVTAYAHLSAILTENGEEVGRQWQVGTSGTTGSSTGPHLHMSTYYLPNWQATDPFGWSGKGENPNSVEDYYLWVDKPGNSMPVPNLSGSKPYPGAIVVDNGDKGWSRTGSWTLDKAKSDIDGDLHWTTTTDEAETATATWTSKLPKDGYYEVGVFVDDNHATSAWAPYTIYYTDPKDKTANKKRRAYVDMSHIGTFQSSFGQVQTGTQWVGIGTYYFSADKPAKVVLSNATGEKGEQLAADAVEFVFVK